MHVKSESIAWSGHAVTVTSFFRPESEGEGKATSGFEKRRNETLNSYRKRGPKKTKKKKDFLFFFFFRVSDFLFFKGPINLVLDFLRAAV